MRNPKKMIYDVKLKEYIVSTSSQNVQPPTAIIYCRVSSEEQVKN
jgi:hypothetical protein